MDRDHGAWGRKIMNAVIILITLALSLIPVTSPAAGAGLGSSLVDLWPVFSRAALEYRACSISPATLAAVSLVESGLDHRLVRVESRRPLPALENSSCLRCSQYLAQRKRWVYVLSIACSEELRRIESLLLQSASFDAGLMQINSWWVKKLGLSLSDLVLSPEDNARIGCMVLAEALSRSGNMHDALEIYHHGHVSDGRYAERVTEALRCLVAALNKLEHAARKEV